MKLFTVGHSNHGIEQFVDLLQTHQITALADVRSHPYSRHLPHYNQSQLKTALLQQRIQYVFLGRELGARPNDPSCYVNGKALYELIAATELFAQGIQRVLKGTEKYTIALMCAEKDPITCHRAILVCQYLRKYDLEINHIHKDGELETHQHLEERLLERHGFDQFCNFSSQAQLSLFSEEMIPSTPSREESLEEAYCKQGFEIAYVEKLQSHYEQVS